MRSGGKPEDWLPLREWPKWSPVFASWSPRRACLRFRRSSRIDRKRERPWVWIRCHLPRSYLVGLPIVFQFLLLPLQSPAGDCPHNGLLLHHPPLQRRLCLGFPTYFSVGDPNSLGQYPECGWAHYRAPWPLLCLSRRAHRCIPSHG